MLVSGIVGVVSGLIADGDWRISLLAGYAGTDFLESLYRLKFSQMFTIAQTIKTITEESPNGKATTQVTTIPITDHEVIRSLNNLSLVIYGLISN